MITNYFMGMNAPATASLAFILNKKQKSDSPLCNVNVAKFLSKSRVCNSNNQNLISSVTFMHMPCLYCYFATSFKS